MVCRLTCSPALRRYGRRRMCMRKKSLRSRGAVQLEPAAKGGDEYERSMDCLDETHSSTLSRDEEAVAGF
jgi:hypothetical protein